MMADSPPMRILHVVDRLARGGVETWLHAVAQHIDRQRFAIDVLVHTDEPQPYDQAMRDLGCRVLPCLRPTRPWRYARAFRRIMREHGPYDVVHGHTHFWNGVVLWLASRAGVPMRIAHSRNTDTRRERHGGPLRVAYRQAMRRLILRHATLRVAVSRDAGTALFGPAWQADPRWTIVPSAIDAALFEDTAPPTGLPAALRDHAGSVAAHIGRFHPQKNHHFLFEVFEAMARRDESVRFVFVGTGGLEPEVRELVERSDALRDRTFFLGDRTDVPALLCHCFDLLLLPSRWEGLGRVAVEAQAAGVPALLAETLPAEATVVPELVERLTLEADAATWAERALAILRPPRPVSRAAALERLRASDFAIERNVEQLQRIYEQARPAKGDPPLATPEPGP